MANSSEITGSLNFFKGEKGDDGRSAYQVAVDNGFEGTEAEWLESLKADWPSDRIAKGTCDGDAVTGAVKVGNISGDYSNEASEQYSFAEGSNTTASGSCAHSEGYGTEASGDYAHAEGKGTVADDSCAHAEGENTTAGFRAHAEGDGTTASGNDAHAEGTSTTASNASAHAEGNGTTASGWASHAEGGGTKASGAQSHAEGGSTTAGGNLSHAEGGGTRASGYCSHAEGNGSQAYGDNSHAEGKSTIANTLSQRVFGEYNVPDPSNAAGSARGTYVEIVGNGTADNARSNARTLDWSGNEVLAGKLTVGTAPENDMDVATKKYVDDNAGGSSFDLSDRMAKGVDGNGDPVDGAVIEGTVSGYNANKALAQCSHAEGAGSTAAGNYSHAEGYYNTASGNYSHSENYYNTASGTAAHAEGYCVVAAGDYSHVEGNTTKADGRSQHVFGEYNVRDTVSNKSNRGVYVEIVGNGTSSAKSNARTLDWSGNEVLAGNITVQGGSLTLGSGNNAVTITAAQLTALLALLQ